MTDSDIEKPLHPDVCKEKLAQLEAEYREASEAADQARYAAMEFGRRVTRYERTGKDIP